MIRKKSEASSWPKITLTQKGMARKPVPYRFSCCGLSDFGSLHMAVLFVSSAPITKSTSLNHHNGLICNLVNPHWFTHKLQVSNIRPLSAWVFTYSSIKKRDIQDFSELPSLLLRSSFSMQSWTGNLIIVPNPKRGPDFGEDEKKGKRVWVEEKVQSCFRMVVFCF